MPFVIGMGIPSDTPADILSQLRQDIVQILVIEMKCPADWARPFFPVDMLDEPMTKADGAHTILLNLQTALFHDRADDDPQVASTLEALASVVSNAFGNTIEVEVAVIGWNPKWKFLLEATK